jgi:type VI secretion system protein ImpG
MLDDLLPYFNQELIHIGGLAEQFAKAHPKVASQLHLGSNAAQDPHIGRLIQSFAFLTAHIQHKLDDDYSALCESLLNIIYPHYLAILPAFSIVRFECKPELTTGYEIDKNTLLETTPHYTESCQFSTVYPVTVWPINVTQANISGLPFDAPSNKEYDKAVSVIKIVLTCSSKDMTFSQLAPGSLLFYINASSQDAYTLYELIFNNTIGLALANSSNDSHASFLDRSAIKSVGFDKDEGLLPYPAHTLIGYRLLTEFFAFPEKFLFFEISGIKAEQLAHLENRLEICIYLNHRIKELENTISASTFQLGCTPVVNLFYQQAEPILLDQTTAEYPVIPDARRPRQLKIHSIENVSAMTTQGKIDYIPFYSAQHGSQSKYFWHTTRKNIPETSAEREGASDFYISFTDLNFTTLNEMDHIVSINLNCTNGNLPSLLPYGAGEPYLQLCSAKAPLSSIQTLMPFTTSFSINPGKGTLWRLISQLSLNYLSLCNNENGKEAIKEILHLYNIKNLAETNNIIDSIVNVSSCRTTARVLSGFHETLSHGTEITIKLDETAFTGSGVYLFSSVLEHFFANYTTLNSFTKLVVKSTKREGILYQWPPRAGNKVLL